MLKSLLLPILFIPFLLKAQPADSNYIRKLQLEEVSVAGKKYQQNSRISASQLERVPAILGEKDILKYLATMPGIASTNALDPGIYVRGGNSTENAFLVNDIEIANPDHLSGILSTFDPYVLNQSVIYKSGFPTKYNSSLSSYLNMSSYFSDLPQWQKEVSIGLLSSSLKARGPIGKKGTTLAASLRGSYLQHMAQLYNKVNKEATMPAYSFYDATASLQTRLYKNLTLDAFGLYSTDQLNLKSGLSTLKWHTLSGNARLRYSAKENLLSLKIGFRSKKTGQGDGDLSDIGGHVNNAFSSELEYGRSLSGRLYLNTGIKYEYSQLGLERKDHLQNNSFNLYSAYAGLKYSLSRWEIDGGINYQFYGGKTNAHSWAPRLRINLSVLQDWNIWLDYAQTNQYLCMYPFYTIKSPVDTWFPLGSNSRPAQCRQYSLGTDKQIGSNLYVYLALFLKDMEDVKDFRDGMRSDFTDWEKSLIEGSGKAKGIEFDFIYNPERFYFRANYTLSESWRRFAGINNGQKFHPPYDIKHNILINCSWKVSHSWSLNALWTYMSGTYATFPVGVSIAQNINNSDGKAVFVPIYRERYNFKLPDNHRLDVNATYFRHCKRTELTFNMGVYNAYNQANASFVYFKPEIKDKYYTRFVPESRVLLPFIPYLSMTIAW